MYRPIEMLGICSVQKKSKPGYFGSGSAIPALGFFASSMRRSKNFETAAVRAFGPQLLEGGWDMLWITWVNFKTGERGQDFNACEKKSWRQVCGCALGKGKPKKHKES
jgi:hypothetical protein